MATNIFTKDIANYLSVSLDVAESIQNVIDNYFCLDWSEADNMELRITYLAAYDFYLKNSNALIQGPHTYGGILLVTSSQHAPWKL